MGATPPDDHRSTMDGRPIPNGTQGVDSLPPGNGHDGDAGRDADGLTAELRAAIEVGAGDCARDGRVEDGAVVRVARAIAHGFHVPGMETPIRKALRARAQEVAAGQRAGRNGVTPVGTRPRRAGRPHLVLVHPQPATASSDESSPANGAPNRADPIQDVLRAAAEDWRQLDDPLNPPLLADAAMRTFRLVAPDGGADDVVKGLYVYEDGVYRLRGEETVRAFVLRRGEEVAEQVYTELSKKLMREGASEVDARTQAAAEAGRQRARVSEDTVAKAVYRIITQCRAPADTFADSDLRYVNCRSGLLDWRTGEMHPHSPDYMSATQLPVEYDPTIRPGRFRRFLEEVLPSQEDQDLLFEWFGYCLLPTTKYQKALLLIGEGSNGKSKILDVLTALLGHENTTAVSLLELTADRFAPAQIIDKLANLCADLADKNAVEDSGTFKKLVAGDAMMAQRKYGDPFSFRPTCRLVFSANSFPRSRDTTYGYWRRWLLLPFPVKIPVERQDPHLSEKLTSPEELSGVLNLALDGLRRLEARGHFPETASMRQALHEYQAQADSIVAFLDPEEERCVFQPDAEVGKEALYQAYSEWCENAGRAAVSRTKFNRHLVATGSIREVNRGGGRGGRVWEGIGLAQ